MGAPLVTSQDVQKLLGGQQTTTFFANGATLIIAGVSDMVRTYCSREFWITSYSESYKGRGGVAIYPKQRPIQSVSFLSVNNCIQAAAGLDPNGAPLSSPGSIGYYFDDTGIYLNNGRFFDSDIPNVFVKYSAGYALFAPTPIYSSLPQDLYEAICKEVAARVIELSRLGLKSQAIDGATTTYNTGPFDPQAKAVFDRYKRTWGTYA